MQPTSRIYAVLTAQNCRNRLSGLEATQQPLAGLPQRVHSVCSSAAASAILGPFACCSHTVSGSPILLAAQEAPLKLVS